MTTTTIHPPVSLAASSFSPCLLRHRQWWVEYLGNLFQQIWFNLCQQWNKFIKLLSCNNVATQNSVAIFVTVIIIIIMKTLFSTSCLCVGGSYISMHCIAVLRLVASGGWTKQYLRGEESEGWVGVEYSEKRGAMMLFCCSVLLLPCSKHLIESIGNRTEFECDRWSAEVYLGVSNIDWNINKFIFVLCYIADKIAMGFSSFVCYCCWTGMAWQWLLWRWVELCSYCAQHHLWIVIVN